MENLVDRIKKNLRKAGRSCPQKELDFVERYLGTKRKFICVKAAERDKIIRESLHELKALPPKDAIKILDELFSSDTFEDFNLAGKLLTKLPEVRRSLDFGHLEKWLRTTNGWAECDCICQSLFSEKEVLDRWGEWEKTIHRFTKDKNIQIRRASLVLQCNPARKSDNPKLTALAFETVEKLKGEKDVLITKAISWVLRCLAVQNGKETLVYLKNNQDSLPKIAYRETLKKITTGKK